eukprot:1901758-Rhodomonas_salina.2
MQQKQLAKAATPNRRSALGVYEMKDQGLGASYFRCGVQARPANVRLSVFGRSYSKTPSLLRLFQSPATMQLPCKKLTSWTVPRRYARLTSEIKKERSHATWTSRG